LNLFFEREIVRIWIFYFLQDNLFPFIKIRASLRIAMIGG
jgi:hypothetical protein